MSDQLTRSEETLVVLLSHLAARRTGQLLEANGYAEPTAAEAGRMTREQVAAFTNLVRGLRAEGGTPSPDEFEEVIHGTAEGAILKVIGLPPNATHDAN